MTKQWLHLPFDSSLYEDFFQRLNSRLTTWIKQAWKWEQASTLSCDFNIICSTFTQMTSCNIMHSLSASWLFMQNVNGCHELVIFSIFFLISFSLGINQSEVGFHLLCCDTRQCQNKSYPLLFSIRLKYKLVIKQRRPVYPYVTKNAEWTRLLCSEKFKTSSVLPNRYFSPTQGTRSLMVCVRKCLSTKISAT